MKRPLLLLLLLLGAVAPFHLENQAPRLESQEAQADLSQDLEGSGDQEGALALPEEEIRPEGEQEEPSSDEDDFEDKEDTELDPSDLDDNFQCPQKEDTVEITGSPGCKTCRYILVRSPQAFRSARRTCRRCYRGDLASIHSYSVNNHLKCMTRGLNQGQVWIGGYIWGWWWFRRFCWTDWSRWNFSNWAAGQPKHGAGRCVALCTRGGKWRRVNCWRRLPFMCSF
ncbi:proteoglycan 3-like [Pteronotus mesoamericanus]|uniref:proteoglycan 3-like n=1 Tax=Pteronotus mesoamericanus TaxID=1884717 RepID=UPI0023ED5D25|nr:proteoglycan 3-like [Pteronotus parnellii mesoamericanus]